MMKKTILLQTMILGMGTALATTPEPSVTITETASTAATEAATAPKTTPKTALDVAKMSIQLLQDCNKVLTEVKDKDSATKAVAQLNALAKDVEKLDEASKNIKAKPEDDDALEKELNNIPVIVNGIIDNCQRLAKDKLISDDLKKAIMNFAKTSGIDSIVEEHLTIQLKEEQVPE